MKDNEELARTVMALTDAANHVEIPHGNAVVLDLSTANAASMCFE